MAWYFIRRLLAAVPVIIGLSIGRVSAYSFRARRPRTDMLGGKSEPGARARCAIRSVSISSFGGDYLSSYGGSPWQLRLFRHLEPTRYARAEEQSRSYFWLLTDAGLLSVALACRSPRGPP